MNRRTVLKSLVAAQAAAALPAQSLPKESARAVEETPKIEATVADADADPVARFFTPEQFAALARLCELMEPSSPERPGAKEARAAEFLDFLLSQSPAERKGLYREGLDRLNAESARRFNQAFVRLDASPAAQVLEPLRRPWSYEEPADPLERFLREAKTDVMEATRNSYEFISVVSKSGRRAGGVGEFWYPLY